MVDKEGQAREIPFGACVWATGVAMNPLIKALQVGGRGLGAGGRADGWRGPGGAGEVCLGARSLPAAGLALRAAGGCRSRKTAGTKEAQRCRRGAPPVQPAPAPSALAPSCAAQGRLPEGTQTHFRSIVTDDRLRVRGSGGSIYALGDAATIEMDKVLISFSVFSVVGVPSAHLFREAPPASLCSLASPLLSSPPSPPSCMLCGRSHGFSSLAWALCGAAARRERRPAPAAHRGGGGSCRGLCGVGTNPPKAPAARLSPLSAHTPPPRSAAQALDKADALFEAADTNGDGKLCLRELHAILKAASKEFPQMEEHARFLDGWAEKQFSGLGRGGLGGRGGGRESRRVGGHEGMGSHACCAGAPCGVCASGRDRNWCA